MSITDEQRAQVDELLDGIIDEMASELVEEIACRSIIGEEEEDPILVLRELEEYAMQRIGEKLSGRGA